MTDSLLPSAHTAGAAVADNAHSEAASTDSPCSSRRMLSTRSWTSASRQNHSMSSCGGHHRASRRSVSNADTATPPLPPSFGVSS
jgi:hypothetical protein